MTEIKFLAGSDGEERSQSKAPLTPRLFCGGIADPLICSIINAGRRSWSLTSPDTRIVGKFYAGKTGRVNDFFRSLFVVFPS